MIKDTTLVGLDLRNDVEKSTWNYGFGPNSGLPALGLRSIGHSLQSILHTE